MGYDVAKFVDRVDENFVCSICSGVQNRSVIGCENGHTFCSACLETWRERGTSCPLCNVDISSFTPAPCLPLQNMIRALTVRCCRVDEGDGVMKRSECTFQGNLDALAMHDRDCGYVVVQCTHQGCIHRCPRRRMAAHAEVCQMKPAICPKCGAEVPPAMMEHHVFECPEEPVTCPMVACGCDVKPKRKDLAKHQAEFMEEHGRLAEAMQARCKAAESRLDAAGWWAPDEEQCCTLMARVREQANTEGEAARDDLTARGAIQLVTGFLVSRRESKLVQVEGFGALLALCASGPAASGAAANAVAALLGGVKGSPRPPLLARAAAAAAKPGQSPPPANLHRLLTRRPSQEIDRLQLDDSKPPPTATSTAEGVSGGKSQAAARLHCAAGAGVLEAAVAALAAHVGEADVHRVACEVLAAIVSGSDPGANSRRARAAWAGAIEWSVGELRGWHSEVSVQQAAAAVLRSCTTGEDDETHANRVRATEAGGIEALCLALVASPKEAALQEVCCRALANVCYGGDATGRARKLRAADAGAIDATAAAWSNFPPESAAAREGVRTLVALLAGLDALGKGRQQRAANAGALRAVVSVLVNGSSGGETARHKAARYRALRNLTRSNEPLQLAAKEAGAKEEWL